MKVPFSTGDIRKHAYTVSEADVASFQGNVVHQVCSTYTLAREMEWAGRLFVLEMINDDEEGVGTYVNVAHKSPAKIGQRLIFIAQFVSSDARGNVHCEVSVTTENGRLVAEGSTGQKILPKTEIAKKFSQL